MKKTLLATTALAALGAVAVAGPAMAAEKIKLSVGGYMEQWFGYGSSDVADQNDRSGFDQQSDSEIHFSGKTTLDNGLTVGVNVQLEGESQKNADNTKSDEIDEAYLFVQSSLGEFGLGSENGPAYKMHFGLASHGAGIDEGDGPAWIAGLNSALNRSSTSAGIDNDNNKIWYISPRVQGFQFGASYAPNDAQDLDAAPNGSDGSRDNQFSVAANMIQTFGDVKVMLSAGYHDAGDDDDLAAKSDIESISTGMRLGFGGFSVNGVYSEFENEVTNLDRTVYGAGVTYAVERMAVSLNWLAGEEDLNGNEEQQDLFELGLSYTLGPGIQLRSSFFYGENDDGDAGTAEADGMAIVGGLKIGF
jgi:hypothetical protein